jgi:tRNA A37 threonylcarbamoyladenosine synthetase subunit TsaC/SUA5/YrdC
VLLWLFVTEYWLHADKYAEALTSIRLALKLATRVPDHETALKLFELQGRICITICNYPGAQQAYQRMRDVAEDKQEPTWTIKAYLLLCQCFIGARKYEDA